MQEITDQIKAWLGAEPDAPFSNFSHAAHALLTDGAKVKALNELVRRQNKEWVLGIVGWPEDEWVIGEDGRGAYYLVSASGKYEGVAYYDHEIKTIEPFQPSLRAFYEYCLQVDGSSKRVRAQFRESLLTYVAEQLHFKPTLKTKFFRDMKVAQADAEQFMRDFAKEFEVDISSFDGKLYGIGEGAKQSGLRGLVDLITGNHPNQGYFTIDHLVDVLHTKKWFDPVR